MAITSLPTVDGDLGPTKSNRRPVTDVNRQITAGEWNVAAEAIEAVTAEVGLSDGSTAGSINAERLGNAAEIGEALADGDHIPVANASAAGAVRKSLLSRVFTYVSQKLFTQNEIGEALTDSDVIAVLDASGPAQKTALVSRIYDYLIAKIPLSWGTWTPTAVPVVNVDSVTSVSGSYVDVGTRVLVAAFVTGIEPAAAAALQFDLPLPVATSFANGIQCYGTFVGPNITFGRVAGDATNDRAQVLGTTNTAAAQNGIVIFVYEVVP